MGETLNRKEVFVKLGIYICLMIGAVFILLPFIWMISTSLKPSNEVLLMPPKWIPSEIMWENYKIAFQSAPFKRYFINSVFVTVMVTAGELITTILAAFAFSNLNFRGKDLLFSILIATMMVPSEILIIPNFVTLSNLGWIDTYKALIIPWCASVFSIFLLRQYFLGIPKQLYYAAKLDGCSNIKYLFLIMVPIAKPAIITLVILKMIGSWNSFMWPLIMTNSDHMRTLPVALSAFSSEAGVSYNLLMAAATMIIVPVFIIYLFLQKHIVAGISRTGIKG